MTVSAPLPPALATLAAVQGVRRGLRLDAMRLSDRPDAHARAALDGAAPVLAEAIRAELAALPAAETAFEALADAVATESQAAMDGAAAAFREAARSMLAVARIMNRPWLANRVAFAVDGPKGDPMGVGTADPKPLPASLAALADGAEVVGRARNLRDAIARRRATQPLPGDDAAPQAAA